MNVNAGKVFEAFVAYGLIFCCLIWINHAKSTIPVQFKHITNIESLTSTYINHITQRRDGFIWIATADGVSRYDGKNFINHKSYPNKPNSLPNPWVNYLLEDHNNQLWVATAAGLAKMLKNELSFEQHLFSPLNENSIAGNNIVHIFEDDNERLWFATDRGLSMYRPESNDFKSFYINEKSDNNGDNNINVIAQKTSQELWIGNDQGLFVFDVNTSEYKPYSWADSIITNINVMDLATDSLGALWIATAEQGLVKLDSKDNYTIRYQHDHNDTNSIVSDGLWSLSIDDEDNIWLASWGEGLSKISAIDGRIDRFSHNRGDQSSIPSNLTTDIFQDQTGLIWISTYGGIAIHDPDNQIENFRPIPGEENSVSSDLIWTFTETASAMWVGTTEGINRLDKNSGVIKNFYTGHKKETAEEFTSVWVMQKAGFNSIWVGTEFGLAQFNTVTNQLSYLSESKEIQRSAAQVKLLEYPVWSLTTNQDRSVWVGTNSSHLYLVDKELRLVKDYSTLLQSTVAKYDNIEFTNITQDANNNLWLSTASGMFFFDTNKESIKPVRSTDGSILFENDWIYAVEPHSKQQFWITSQSQGLGLFKLHSAGTIDRLLHFDNSHTEITEKSIYTVLPINDFEVWFTGRKNLYHLDLLSYEITNFGHSYFETGLEFHENSQHYSMDGNIYLGSNKGVVRFNPLNVSKSNFQPRVYFTGIQSNNMSIATTLSDPVMDKIQPSNKPTNQQVPVHLIKNHEFESNNSLLTFQFSALDYMHAENLNYAYRISEIDNRWINLNKRNELTLTNLTAGKYHLEVKATNADLQWSDHTASIEFTLLAKPWLTWWAKLFYILLLILIALLIFRLYRGRLLTQYQLDHREVQLSQAIWGSGDELWEWNINKQQIIRTSNKDLDDNRRRFFNGSFESNDLDIHPDDITGLQQKIQDLLSGKNNEFDAVYRQKNHQGTWLWMQDRAKVTVWSENKKPLIINGISRNINAIKKKEEKSQLIATAFQSSSDGALVLDANLKVISINAAFTEITGYDDRIIDDSLNTHSGRIFTQKMDSNALYKHIKRDLREDGAFRDEILIKTIYNTTLPIDLRVNCIYNAQKLLTHYIATLTDITYHKDTEKVLTKLANYDSLTGLPNRSLMMIQLDRALTQAQQNSKQMAIMFIDLDHFKNINDSLGHTIGDELLIAVAKRLSVCIKTSDTIARIGGDEFTIGILNYDSSTDVIKLAEDILNTMSKPFQLENHELIITPSIGIAIYNGGQVDTETLLMQADTAMYHAKKKGRNNFRFFTESMNQAVLKRVDIEMRLRKALENQEFSLNYQPKYSLKTGHVSGFEALLRWNDKHGNITPPDEFIPIAEETGLIFSIGEFVLQSACQELKNWHSCGHESVSIAINLSAIQFMDKKLVESVGQIIQKFKTPPMSLEIEITESTLIENLPYAIKTLKQLRKLGVKLSLDDFGTGFSSLNYLKQFPIHALKIDRSFILDMVSDTRDASMVASIISLAHNLSIDVIAEGVETQEQLSMLIAFEVEEVQGFLLSKPINSDKVVQILNKNQTVSSLLSH